jgi:glycine/D-amino acid oxidase-like deaminating enzyme
VLGGFRDFSILTEMTDEETTTEPIQEALDPFLVELLGYLPEVTHRWAGIFGLTHDLLPLVARVPSPRIHGSPPAIRATGTSWASCAAS